MNTSTNPVEIVLTGGPAGGKTSALRYLVDHLSGRGWRTLVVPEAATQFLTGGLHDIGHLAATDRRQYLTVQRHLIGLQAALRHLYRNLAADLAEKTVILYDRAELDNRAYLSPAEFAETLRAATGQSVGEVSAEYDAVVHLVTAADGAAAHYTLANNQARTEDPAAAVRLDRAVQDAWLGHSHYTVIGNREPGGFDAKLRRTLAAVLGVLGEPEPVEIERKWLLAAAPDPDVLAAAAPVEIEQIYLAPTGPTRHPKERRIRARTHDGHTTYFHTAKEPLVPGPGRVEVESRISAETYRYLAEQQAPGSSVIRKRRYCFVHDGQHFELDHIQAPVGLWLLEAELVTAADEVRLPERLRIAREVTEDDAYTNGSIARSA